MQSASFWCLFKWVIDFKVLYKLHTISLNSFSVMFIFTEILYTLYTCQKILKKTCSWSLHNKPILEWSFTVLDATTATLTLYLISKSAISASFLIIYPFAGELYPTQLRGLGIGTSAYIGGLGLIIIPFITYLVHH